MKKIPPTFCWTKMGAEAGEELAAIIRRKEWERQLGGGYFFWGIGQSLGENAKAVAPEITSLHVIFSPMPSKPKLIDVAPNDVVIWNAWIDAQGVVRRLPIHCFITSRASLPSGRKKESHYALVCFSDQELNKQSNEIFVFPNYLRNVATNKPLGASQVTAVVRAPNLKDKTSDAKSYSVSFTAELRSPYCVQLAQPLLLGVEELIEIKEITNSGDIGLWNALVKSIRSRMIEQTNWVQCTLDFVDEDDLSFTDSLSPLHCSEYSNV